MSKKNVFTISDEEFARIFPDMPSEDIATRYSMTPSQVKRRARLLRLYKSPACRSASSTRTNMGHPKKPETREKIRQALLGRTLPKEHVDNMRRGSKHSLKVKRGKDHPFWKGGRPPWQRYSDPRYQEWRRAVVERDNYICQNCTRQCRRSERGLAAHHIKPYATHEDLRYVVSNGITLCDTCHRARHGTNRKPLPPVPCACGCGTLIAPIDRYGIPRQFGDTPHGESRGLPASPKRRGGPIRPGVRYSAQRSCPVA